MFIGHIVLLRPPLGTHRFQRAVSAIDLLLGISPPPNLRRCSGSYKFVFRRDCTLEAMRTRGPFSLFQVVTTRHENSSEKGRANWQFARSSRKAAPKESRQTASLPYPRAAIFIIYLVIFSASAVN